MTLKLANSLIQRCFATCPKKTIKDVQEALQRQVSILKEGIATTSTVESLEGRTMSDSRDQVIIPLASAKSDKLFLNKYISWHNLVRFGMLLEDLDTFAVWLAYRHNFGTIPSTDLKYVKPMIFVTACVDHIRIDEQHKIVLDEDIYMDGYVSWVGRSSLEVSMALIQKNEGVSRKFLQSKFVMVARDLAGKQSLVNVPLKTRTPEEEAIFNEGKKGQQLRKLNEDISLQKTPPNEKEIEVLHEIFKKTSHFGGKLGQCRILPADHVWIHNARLNGTIVCFPVKRNIYGKIFGGFLMRKAVELGWSNASIFSGNRCCIRGVDDIIFRKSVDVGSIVVLSSQEYDAQSSMEWMQQKRPLFILLLIAYTTFVCKAPRIWGRKRIEGLERIIFCWNIFNALADGTLFLSLLPEFLGSFRGGFYSSLCVNNGLYRNARTGKALLTFHISKVWELLDTVFVILDGRETNAVHVTHHVVTCIFSLYTYQHIGAVIRWIAITNLAAHSVLYAYLAAQSCARKNRSRSAHLVNSLQLAQFLICLWGFLKIRQFHRSGKECETKFNWLAVTVYVVFFILFALFYVKRYRRRSAIRNRTMDLSSQRNQKVCYSVGQHMQLIIDAEVLDVETRNRETTNTFYLTFESNRIVPTVIPYSYSDGMLYLDAKRHYNGFKNRSNIM